MTESETATDTEHMRREIKRLSAEVARLQDAKRLLVWQPEGSGEGAPAVADRRPPHSQKVGSTPVRRPSIQPPLGAVLFVSRPLNGGDAGRHLGRAGGRRGSEHYSYPSRLHPIAHLDWPLI